MLICDTDNLIPGHSDNHWRPFSLLDRYYLLTGALSRVENDILLLLLFSHKRMPENKITSGFDLYDL